MEVRASPAEVLRETLKDMHPNETFEKALGRIVRKHQGTYRDYRELIHQVRDRARKDRSSLDEAAQALAASV